jgi:peptidoglycan/xylan/chitin deacetylase (PgdA/CDA1 family)
MIIGFSRSGMAASNFRDLFVTRSPIFPIGLRIGLKIIQICGLFRIARLITRCGLRIICYHGFALADEYKYRGTLFIQDDLFRRRMEYLKRENYPIMSLSEAVDALAKGRLPPCATVITMDDGWRGVYTLALPIIKQLRIPVTVYVATYYVENQVPVFIVASSYLFWLTKERRVVLPRGLGTFELQSQSKEAEELAHEFGALLPPADQLEFLRELAQALNVPFDPIEKLQMFRLMDESQLRQLATAHVDIQLHSHSHRWPLYDRQEVEAEIAVNRRILERVAPTPLEHFCYPSGVYGAHQGEWLAAMGMKSASTIEPGFNYGDTSRFALRRIVDGGRVSDIEFAAEMAGFMEIVRWCRQGQLLPMLRHWFRLARHSGA